MAESDPKEQPVPFECELERYSYPVPYVDPGNPNVIAVYENYKAKYTP